MDESLDDMPNVQMSGIQAGRDTSATTLEVFTYVSKQFRCAFSLLADWTPQNNDVPRKRSRGLGQELELEQCTKAGLLIRRSFVYGVSLQTELWLWFRALGLQQRWQATSTLTVTLTLTLTLTHSHTHTLTHTHTHTHTLSLCLAPAALFSSNLGVTWTPFMLSYIY